MVNPIGGGEHNILKYTSKVVYFQNTTLSKSLCRLFYNHPNKTNGQAQWCLVDIQQLDQLVSEMNCISKSKELA